jgi:hypothetical protein
LSDQFFGDVTVGTEGEIKAPGWDQIGVRFEKPNSDFSVSRRESDHRNLDDSAASVGPKGILIERERLVRLCSILGRFKQRHDWLNVSLSI